MHLTFNDDSFIKQMRKVEGFTEKEYSDEYLRAYFKWNHEIETDLDASCEFGDCVDELRHYISAYTLVELSKSYEMECENSKDVERLAERYQVRFFYVDENLILIRHG